MEGICICTIIDDENMIHLSILTERLTVLHIFGCGSVGILAVSLIRSWPHPPLISFFSPPLSMIPTSCKSVDVLGPTDSLPFRHAWWI